MAISCILVKHRFSISFRGVEYERQRVASILPNIIHRRPERHRCIGSDIDSRPTKRSVSQDMSRAFYALSCPEVEPGSGGNIGVAILHSGMSNGRYQQGIAA